MKTFKNRVAAITGASSGIGRALAVELASRGTNLALSDVDEVGMAETRRQCEAAGVKVITDAVDVSDRDAVYAWADRVVAHYGVVHMIFNNAGIAIHATNEEVPIEVFRRVIDIDFWGVVYGTRAFLPHLKKAPEAHIVNISSVFGLVGVPGQGPYNCAKFAVRGFSESLRQELDLLAPHVRCSCVHPGGIKTNIARAAGYIGQQLGVVDREALARRFDKLAQTTPEEAAGVIVDGVRRDQARILVGQDARLLDAIQRLAPQRYQAFMRRPYEKILKRNKR